MRKENVLSYRAVFPGGLELKAAPTFSFKQFMERVGSLAASYVRSVGGTECLVDIFEDYNPSSTRKMLTYHYQIEKGLTNTTR